MKVPEGLGCDSKTSLGVSATGDICLLHCSLTVCLSGVPSIPSHSGCSARPCSWRLTLKICLTQAELSSSLQAGIVAGHVESLFPESSVWQQSSLSEKTVSSSGHRLAFLWAVVMGLPSHTCFSLGFPTFSSDSFNTAPFLRNYFMELPVSEPSEIATPRKQTVEGPIFSPRL